MIRPKKENHKEKPRLHPRNKNRERYDFKELIAIYPDLEKFVKLNINNEESIDFADQEAVKTLNNALLLHQYGIVGWDIPDDYLCPPIPVRADYIHHIADFLCRNNYGKIPAGSKIKCLDIGVGASCIYPIIGNKEYGWSFIGADIDPVSIESANRIIASNPSLEGKIECILQKNPKDFFYGIIRKDESIDLSVCNPPFYASAKEALAGTIRKQPNLTLNSEAKNNELWCDGGEDKFVRNMVLQSKKFAENCFCFSTLVSKDSNLRSVCNLLEQVGASGVETITMGQGNKTSRIVAWTFLSAEEQNKWKNTRWK